MQAGSIVWNMLGTHSSGFHFQESQSRGSVIMKSPKYFVFLISIFLVHPANEYLQDEKGHHLSSVNSPCGGILSFLP